jgi:serine/threonine protein kinase
MWTVLNEIPRELTYTYDEQSYTAQYSLNDNMQCAQFKITLSGDPPLALPKNLYGFEAESLEENKKHNFFLTRFPTPFDQGAFALAFHCPYQLTQADDKKTWVLEKIDIVVKQFKPEKFDSNKFHAEAKYAQLFNPGKYHENSSEGILAMPHLGINLLKCICDQAGTDQNIHKETFSLWPFQQRLDIMLAVAKALKKMHDQNCLHRDIKPMNICVKFPALSATETQDAPPVVSLIDFEHTTPMFHQDFVRHGSWHYQSPESYNEEIGCAVSPASDVFSLGRTFFHLLVGRLPGNTKLEKIALAEDMAQCCDKITEDALLCNDLETAQKTTLLTLFRTMTHRDPIRRPLLTGVITHLSALKKNDWTHQPPDRQRTVPDNEQIKEAQYRLSPYISKSLGFFAPKTQHLKQTRLLSLQALLDSCASLSEAVTLINYFRAITGETIEKPRFGFFDKIRPQCFSAGPKHLPDAKIALDRCRKQLMAPP